MSRHRKHAAALAVVPLLIAACGGSSDAGPAGGATAESWCKFVIETDAVDEVFDSFGDSSADLKEGITKVEELIKRLPGEAPAAIKAPAQTLADNTLLLVDAVKAADYSLLDADLSYLDNQELEARTDAATDELDAFTQTECGRSFTSDDDDVTDSGIIGDETDDDSSDFDAASGTIREQLVTQFESIGLSNAEATCIADELDFNDPAVASGDIGAMLGVFELCNIDLARLSELGGG